MLDIIGKVLMVLGVIFIACGVFGVFRFNTIYSRILITGNIDTVGFMILTVGLILREGFTFASAKIATILIFALVTNPVATNAITKSAYESGYKTKQVK